MCQRNGSYGHVTRQVLAFLRTNPGVWLTAGELAQQQRCHPCHRWPNRLEQVAATHQRRWLCHPMSADARQQVIPGNGPGACVVSVN